MTLARINNGERTAGLSAILLFVLMFFDWFEVELTNTSKLLFAVQGGSGRSAWEALDYIPIALVITITAALAVVVLHIFETSRRPAAALDAVIAILGLASALAILFRIIEPPVFYVESTITSEGTVEAPIFLALLAAIGIVFGSCQAMREEGVSPSG